MMFFYDIGCRYCFNGEENHSYLVQNGDISFYQKKTEFETKILIEKWRKEDGHFCKFCSSNNVEVLEVKVGDYPLYNFNRLVNECKHKKNNLISDESIFEIRLDKTNSEIKVEIGGEQKINRDFLKKCLSEIIELINQSPIESFISHKEGDFFISLSGGLNFKTHVEDVKVQRCRRLGYGKEELLKCMNQVVINFGFSENIEQKNNTVKKSWWQF